MSIIPAHVRRVARLSLLAGRAGVTGGVAAPGLGQVLARMHRRLVAFAVLAAGLAIMASGTLILRDYTQRNLALVSRTVSYTVEPAMVFGDHAAAREAVASVARMQGVRRVEVFDQGGRRVVDWSPPVESLDARIESLAARIFGLAAAHDPVMRGRGTIGQVRVSGSAAVFARYLLSGLLISFACLLLAGFAGQMLSLRFDRSVIAPIENACQLARRMRTERRFDARLPSSGVAEFDRLGDDFNALAAELQAAASN